MPSENVMLLGTLIPIAAILIGGLLLLIPVAGLTLRFALKPAMEAYAQMREAQGQDRTVQLLEQRVALLEEQLHALSRGQPPLPGAAGAPGTVPVGRIAGGAPASVERPQGGGRGAGGAGPSRIL